ncbi:MAG: disulfide bond formation protein B [Actinomycetota bacterium]
MPTETATLFFALLASALAAGLLVLGVSAVTGRPGGLVSAVSDVAVELAALVAVAATAGSLYLSEIADFRPCFLCWVQRGFMYPAAILLLVGVVTRHRLPVLAAGVLAAVGLPIALFHRYEQAVGELGALCDASNPCSSRWVSHFGFVTIPTMAAVGFAAVAILTTLHLRRRTT